METNWVQRTPGLPPHTIITLGQGNFHQPAATWPARTPARIWSVVRPVGGTQQPVASDVKHLIGLPVEFHRHMGAAVQVCMRLPQIADGKRPARLPGIRHVKRHSKPLLRQFVRATEFVPIGVSYQRVHLSRIGQEPSVQILHGVCNQQWLK